MEEIYAYYIDNIKYNRSDEFKELEYRKGRDRWEKLLKSYQDVKTEKPIFQNITFKETKDIVLETMIEILGISYKEKLEYILSKVKEEKGKDLNCTTEWNIVNDEPNLINLHITGSKTSKSIWLLGHESIHALLLPFETTKFNKTFGNIHYHELPSILMERMLALHVLDKIKEKDYIEKTESLRLKDTKEWASAENNVFNQIKEQKIEILEYFMYHNQKTHILSDVYANRLLELYKDTPKIVLEKYRNFLKGELCLIDLLSYFGISLKDNNTYFDYQKKLQYFREK